MKCPFCVEEVQPDAQKCKHCGEWLDKQAAHAGRAKEFGRGQFVHLRLSDALGAAGYRLHSDGRRKVKIAVWNLKGGVGKSYSLILLSE